MTPPQDKPVGSKLGWRTVASNHPFTSQWFSLRSDTVSVPGDSEPRLYSYVEHTGSVMIVPMLSDGRIVLIRSYRYPLDAWCWEIPGGQLVQNLGPEGAARAELAEEIGATCDSLHLLLDTQMSNGFARCRTLYYLARGVRLTAEPKPEIGEAIERTEMVSLSRALELILDSGQDGDSALGLLLAARHLSQGDEQ